MKEIGGYLEFERYHFPMRYDDGIKLNCGRNCLAYLIEANQIEKIWLPYYICDSVINLCQKYALSIRFYHIGLDLKPINIVDETDAWVYLVNYYGQLSNEDICRFKSKYKRLIVDNTQAYYDEPVAGVDTLYTCRKFFGVADGAVLYANKRIDRHLETDESFEHMAFLMGRFERSASEFYSWMVDNNHRFEDEPIKKMSKLTENLLHGIDYAAVARRRNENYRILEEKLSYRNMLKASFPKGAFAYPLMIENASEIKKKLIEQKIYIPTLWPNVLNQTEIDSVEYRLARDVLPVPCDQRYGREEMEYVVRVLDRC